MVSPLVSYIVLAVATFVISSSSGLHRQCLSLARCWYLWLSRADFPMLGAMALALAGQGMALGRDIVIQGAPGLTAAAAGVPVALVTSKAGWLSAITGIVALVLAYLFMRPEIARFQSEGEPDAELPVEPEGKNPGQRATGRKDVS